MGSLEEVWEQREQQIYPKWFGPESRGIFTLTPDLFRQLGQSEVDPCWLSIGIFEFAPTESRPTWIYVSSGISNPWETDPKEYSTEGYSEIGTELVLETPHQADWANSILQRLVAFDVLISWGLKGDVPTFDYGHRIPLNAPISPTEESALRNVIAWKPEHYEPSFVVPSGRVDFIHLAGMSDAELAYAKEHGSDRLAALMIEHGAFPVTDPARASIL
ncbi:suppressor of fused domain protein [Pelagibius sp. 7325]|uniref:suppressor of fused domain protein n=1 Tax=Pelagibius sp. 7325 TaxID=3131994 RepID=UPI0030EE892C